MVQHWLCRAAEHGRVPASPGTPLRHTAKSQREGDLHFTCQRNPHAEVRVRNTATPDCRAEIQRTLIFQSEPSRSKHLSRGNPLRYPSSGTTWPAGRDLQNPLLQKANKPGEQGEVTAGDGLREEPVISALAMSIRKINVAIN